MTGSVLDIFPQDAWSHVIIERLNAPEARNLSLSSQRGYEIVKAATNRTYEDVSPSGKPVTVSFDGNIAAFFRYKVKKRALTESPGAVIWQSGINTARTMNSGDPEDIKDLIKFNKKMSQDFRIISLVLFDFDTKQIPPGSSDIPAQMPELNDLPDIDIGSALIQALNKLEGTVKAGYNPEFGMGGIRIVFAHPHI